MLLISLKWSLIKVVLVEKNQIPWPGFCCSVAEFYLTLFTLSDTLSRVQQGW